METAMEDEGGGDGCDGGGGGGGDGRQDDWIRSDDSRKMLPTSELPASRFVRLWGERSSRGWRKRGDFAADSLSGSLDAGIVLGNNH